MKKMLALSLLLLSMAITTQLTAQSDANWSKHRAKKWFNKKEWLGGARVMPHESIDKRAFAKQYSVNKIYWDKAFDFLKTHDLDSLPKGKYVIDGTNVTASVTEDPSKDFEKTNWESHKKMIDLQLIISGEEKMGVYPVLKSTVTKEYDEKKDVANYSADGKFYVAGPGTFFIFFPTDAHRPNITPGGNKVVKKLVFKIKYN